MKRLLQTLSAVVLISIFIFPNLVFASSLEFDDSLSETLVIDVKNTTIEEVELGNDEDKISSASNTTLAVTEVAESNLVIKNSLPSEVAKSDILAQKEASKSDLPIVVVPETPYPDFKPAPKPARLRFIKIQIEDSTRDKTCSSGAEFIVIRNFGGELNRADFVLKVGNNKKDYQLGSGEWKPNQDIVLYSKDFVDCSPDQKTSDNSNVTDWLSKKLSMRFTGSSKNLLSNKSVLRIVPADKNIDFVYDEVDLSQIDTTKKHDTLVAQADAEELTTGGFVFDKGDNLIWRSLRVHWPAEHLLSYEEFPQIEQDINQPTPKKNLCSGLAINEVFVNATSTNQFIEIVNLSDEIVDLKGCYLRANWSGEARHEFGDFELDAFALKTIFIKDSKLKIERNQLNTIRLYNEEDSEIDALQVPTLQAPNSSLARFNGEFQQTFRITPGLPNVDFPELPCKENEKFVAESGTCQKIEVSLPEDEDDDDLTCKEGYEVGFTGTCVKKCSLGYERNPDTNRCRKIEVESDPVLSECPIGYERNPATNRCRKITVATQAVLAPCPIGYERNPATNRCRKISNQQDCADGYEIGFTGTCVKKCQDGYERNPDTNHCRKLVAQAGESDVAGAFSTPNSSDETSPMPLTKLAWWQVALGVLALAVLVLIRHWANVLKFFKGLKK